jgi:acyl transferase domain-containing protein
MASLYPDARGLDEFWRLLLEPTLSCDCGQPPDQETPGWRRCGHCGDPPHPGLDDIVVDLARFGIPPAQAGALTRLQVLMLEAARQCLADGSAGRALPAERTDVIVATCGGLDRQFANALRVEASRYARSVRQVLDAQGQRGDEAAAELTEVMRERLGASAHDRVGEMASTIPARIAAAFGLKGRTLAVECADASSFAAVDCAVTTLRSGSSDAVLVLAGQGRESSLFADALAAKGVLTGANHPFADDSPGFADDSPGFADDSPGFAGGSPGFALGEGVGAVLLKRCSSAAGDGDRVYALIRACALSHPPRPGTFRYPVSPGPRRAAAATAYQSSGVDPASIQYVECTGAGSAAQSEAELSALAAALGDVDQPPVLVGSVKDRLGHTFANAGLASLTKVALALHYREIPPQGMPAGPPADPADPRPAAGLQVPRGLRRWRPGRGGAPRRAAVNGASLTGTLCHLILEEYVAAAPAPAPTRSPNPAPTPAPTSADGGLTGPAGVGRVTAGPEPIAIVAAGARFAGCPDTASFWRAVRAGQAQIRELPPERLDRELYFAPGQVSLAHTYTDLGAAVTVPDQPPDGLAMTPARYAGLDSAQRLSLHVAGELFGPDADRARALRGPGLIAVGSTLCLATERSADVQRRMAEFEAAADKLSQLAVLDDDERAMIRKLVRERYAEQRQPAPQLLLDGFLASGSAAIIANEYGLTAVPLAVEAACASSLAAVDIAVQALRSRTIDFAVAGGVELGCTERDLVLCSGLGLLSHSRITPFGPDADGFTPGDGCALFLLKRRDDALRAGDPVLGLIRGVGAANDAKSLIAPDRDGQARAMRRAFTDLELSPDDVDYLEAHGTGTRVGDQTEIEAIREIYTRTVPARPLAVGSVKSFFGHTFAAAGGASLLCVLQAIRHQALPPIANFGRPNPALDLAAIPASLHGTAAPWPASPGRPRRAAVSSFGTGGINYHLLVEEYLDGGHEL